MCDELSKVDVWCTPSFHVITVRRYQLTHQRYHQHHQSMAIFQLLPAYGISMNIMDVRSLKQYKHDTSDVGESNLVTAAAHMSSLQMLEFEHISI